MLYIVFCKQAKHGEKLPKKTPQILNTLWWSFLRTSFVGSMETLARELHTKDHVLSYGLRLHELAMFFDCKASYSMNRSIET